MSSDKRTQNLGAPSSAETSVGIGNAYEQAVIGRRSFGKGLAINLFGGLVVAFAVDIGGKYGLLDGYPVLLALGQLTPDALERRAVFADA